MQASPKKSSKGKTKTFLLVPLVKTTEGYWKAEYNMQCPLTNFLKISIGNTLAHFQVFRILWIRKKDLLHIEFIENSCTGMFIIITKFEEYLS